MTKMTSNYDNVRKKTALLVACLIVFVGLFGTGIAFLSFELSGQLNEIEAYEKEALESFLQLALRVDQANLNTFEMLFENMVTEYGDEVSKEYIIEKFTNEVFDSVLDSAALSIIIAYDEEKEMIRAAYKNQAYEEKLELLEQINVGEELIVINETDKGVVFGQGDRVYLSGRKLNQIEGTTLYLYTGFDEQVRISGFISTLKMDSLHRSQTIINKIAKGSMHFTYILGVISIVMIALIRKFNIDMIKAYASSINDINPILKQSAFGEIAVRNGFLTINQVEKCLEEQAMEMYNKYKKDE